MGKTEAKTTEKAPVSLEAMLGIGGAFEAQGKQYAILPIKVKEILEMKKEYLHVREEAQGYNFFNEANFENVQKWLRLKVRDENDKPMSIERAAEDDWDTDDVAKCIQRIYKVSGF